MRPHRTRAVRPRQRLLRAVGWVATAIVLWLPGAARAQVVDTLPVDTLPVDTLGADSLAVDTLGASAMDSAAVGDSLDGGYAGPLPEDAATRVGYIMVSDPRTPDQLGLVATGMAEAEIAAQHVALAGRDTTNLFNMQRHMAHVLHAIDPGEVGQGPGLGFGVVRAAEAVLAHIEEVRLLDDLPGVMDFHAPWVARAARGTLARADEAVALARQVQRASGPAEGHRLVEGLADAVRAMAYGFDRDGDGRIGYTEDEMGLAQVRYHLELVRRVAR